MNEERLYNLLPAIYRVRDQDAGEPLRALLSVIEGEFQTIQSDLAALYDNWFIETCDEWVVPYIADLLGIDTRNEDVALPFSRRSLIAHTLTYRRWKGTPSTLERAARDATGWQACMVETINRLATTQSMRAPRPDRGGTVDLRKVGQLGPIGDPFDTSAHTVDLSGETRVGEASTLARAFYNLSSVAFYFWRLTSYPVSRGTARLIRPCGYTFSPFGLDIPLFNRPRSLDTRNGRVTAMNVPGPLHRQPLADEIQAQRRGDSPRTDFLGTRPAFAVFVREARGGIWGAIPSQRIFVTDLGEWSPPPGDGGDDPWSIAVDPTLGRLTLPDGVEVSDVEVSYAHGFSANLGGGPYDRRATLFQADSEVWRARVGRDVPAADEPNVVTFDSLAEAIAAWAATGQSGVIQIADNRTYDLRPPDGVETTSDDSTIVFAEPRFLVIEAANDTRPVIVGDLTVNCEHPDARLRLNGIWLDGAIHFRGNLKLDVMHCTLRPTGRGPTARPSILWAGGEFSLAQVAIASSIVGPIRLPSDVLGLRVDDSIVDGLGDLAIASVAGDEDSGPALAVERTTVLGSVAVGELVLASNVLFSGPVIARRRNTGEARFSYVPDGSKTPRRQHCQPDLAIAGIDPAIRPAQLLRLTPTFTSEVYGDPGYAQLSLTCPSEIRTGSEEGSEIGVFHLSHAPQRAARLREVLNDYLPYHLSAEIIYVT